MKFKICTVDIWNDPEKIKADYPCVNDFGFESVKLAKTRKYRQLVGNIETIEKHTIDQPYVNIDSLERLLEFCKTVEHPLIISLYGDVPEIENYDGYRE